MGTHLIQTQIIEADFKDKHSAHEAQKLLQSRYRDVLMPIMEKVFDEHGPYGRSLRIDKLELDLGRFPADLPESLMRDRFLDVLENQMRKTFLEQGILNRPTDLTHYPSINQDQPDIYENYSDWEKITYYLLYGRMPWWALTKGNEPLQSLFIRATISNDSALDTWLKENTISVATTIRLSELLSENQLRGVLKNYFQLAIKDLQLVTKILVQLLSTTRLKTEEVRFWLTTLLLLTIFGNRNGFTSYLESGFNFIKKSDINETLKTSEFLCFLSYSILKITGGNTMSGVTEPDLEFIKLIGKNAIHNSEKKSTIAASNQFWKKVMENLQTKSPRLEELSTQSKELLNQIDHENKSVKARSPEVNELLVINNAGMVLVAAFLPKFFENLSLVKAREFIDKNAQSKAVYLLQEMLRIEEPFDESDLILNKLLCGIEPAAALGPKQEINTSEKLEINSLLESMATQWTALKSNSGKMIAEGFFRREGSLRRVQKGYQLQIERLPFDLLLDRLPWTIGMIKLPWMEEVITVEW